LDQQNGRCVVLWPHGILFRDSEKDMRRKMVLSDTVEAIIALGKNLFYNSSMESCLLVCNNHKSKERKGKVLFINAYNEIRNEKTISFLDEPHIKKIYNCFKDYNEILDFSNIVSIDEILKTDASLHVTKYVKSSRITDCNDGDIKPLIQEWIKESDLLKQSISSTIKELKSANGN